MGVEREEDPTARPGLEEYLDKIAEDLAQALGHTGALAPTGVSEEGPPGLARRLNSAKNALHQLNFFYL